MADRDPGPFAADPAAYDTDVHAWTLAQAALLRARRFEALDLGNIIEEIESLGNEQEHAIESHLVLVLEHLTKLAVSADQIPQRGWRRSEVEGRGRIAYRLKKNPSLRRMLPELFDDAWALARKQTVLALREAEEHLVPAEPPFTLAQTLDPDWFPGA